MIDPGTLAGLHRHKHQLAAYCQQGDPTAQLVLQSQENRIAEASTIQPPSAEFPIGVRNGRSGRNNRQCPL